MIQTLSKLLLFGLVVTLISCGGNDVLFLNPQPQGAKKLQEFKIEGTYSNLSDSTLFIDFDLFEGFANEDASFFKGTNDIAIKSNYVLNKIAGYLFIDMSKADSADEEMFNLPDIMDSLILEYFNKPTFTYTTQTKGDTLLFKINIIDTLFAVSSTHVLTLYKKKYYLNIKNEKGSAWIVYQLYTEKDALWIKALTTEDGALMERLMTPELPTDDAGKYLNPSKKTFKKFLKMKGFQSKIKFQG